METLATYLEQKKKAEEIVRFRTLFAAVAGFIPLPLLDATGILTIQLWMLRDLAKLYNVPFKQHLAKSLIGSLVSNISSAGLIKFIPGFGQLLGGGAVAVSGGAATYALGKVFTQHFDQGGTLLSFDPAKSQEHFRKLYEEGKVSVPALQAQEAGFLDVQARTLASTAALKKANDDLTATIAALQQQLEQSKKDRELTTAAAVVPEKKRRRFGWMWALLFLLLLALAGVWAFRAGYFHKVFGKSAPATETAKPLARATANSQNQNAPDTLSATDSTQTELADTITAGQNAQDNSAAPTAGPNAAALHFPPGSSEAQIADYMSALKSKFPKSFSLQAVQFAAGATELNADARLQVEHIAALLDVYPEATVKIYGRTDPHEGQAANRQLGRNRAKAIENVLKQHGVKGRRIDTAFLEAPVSPGSPGGVEIEILKR